MTKLILPLLLILCVVGCGEGSHLSEIEETKEVVKKNPKLIQKK
jgi:hypothetical protein